jgi:hypothetical protein
MNYAKYSKQQFSERGLDTPASRQLADELQADVAKEIHEAVLAAFLKIVEGLNAQGHNLASYGEIRVGDIPFRDEQGEGFCYLRLGCDAVISAGYAHIDPPTRAKNNIE